MARNTLIVLAGIIASLAISTPLSLAQSLGEALGATNLVWTTGGDAPWFVETTNTYDGNAAAAQIGIVLSNQTSWLQTTVVGPATIDFWSYGEFDLSNQFCLGWAFTINSPVPQILPAPGQPFPGIPPWEESIYDLGAGTNVLLWTAVGERAGSENCYLDIDNISISPPRPLSIQRQPGSATNYSGTLIFLSVTAIGTPPLQYQWYFNGTNILGATNNLLRITGATTNNTGVYTVLVTNSQGSVLSSNATITILPPSAPFFTGEPSDTVVYTGQSFTWTAGFDGSPLFYPQWTKDGTNLPGAIDRWLTFPDVSLSDAGTYTLIISNSWGVVESTNAALTVIQSVAPVFTNQPRSLDVAEGVNTWMRVGVSAVPDPDIAWGTVSTPPVVSPPGLVPQFLQSQLSTLSFNNVTATNAGVYYAVANNYGGQAASQEALLTVLPPITNVVTWYQDALDIFVTNGLAFLARGTNGLSILSVTNPASPQLLGTFPTVSYIFKVTVSGNLAFVSDVLHGLQIISVTNPFTPVLIGQYTLPNQAEQVVVRSNLVYMASGTAGLSILDVSNPATPSLVGSYAGDFLANSVTFSGNDAILGAPRSLIIYPGGPSYIAGLFVIDVSDPADPNEVGQLSTGIGNLDAEGQNVFGLANGELEVLTMTNPVAPAVIGKFNNYPMTNLSGLFVSAQDAHVVNDLAYIAGYSGTNSQVFVVDVRDATQPIPVGYYTDASQPTALAVDGNFIFVAGPGSPLEILQTPFNTNPVAAPFLSVPAQAGFNLSIQGRHGHHYDVQYSDSLSGIAWQTLETILLTNDTAVITPPSGPAARFFRLKQDD